MIALGLKIIKTKIWPYKWIFLHIQYIYFKIEHHCEVCNEDLCHIMCWFLETNHMESRFRTENLALVVVQSCASQENVLEWNMGSRVISGII